MPTAPEHKCGHKCWHTRAIIATVFLILIIALVVNHHSNWMKKNCVCKKSSTHRQHFQTIS